MRSELEASYVISCDGARSLVRQTLGIPFHGVGREAVSSFAGRCHRSSCADCFSPGSGMGYDTSIDDDAWIVTATAWGFPLPCLRWPDPVVRTLYGADRVLIRPDHHIAWRGPAGCNAESVLRRATGRLETQQRT